MRITDLLDKRSIAFDKNPANKQETLDMAVPKQQQKDK